MVDLVTLSHLTKRFTQSGGLLKPARSMTAVRDVSLSLAAGSVTGVVGESGCGKSTLARLVLRLIEPTEGRVFHSGTDLTALSGKTLRLARRNMAMVFQDPYSSLDPRYTLADVLAEPYRAQAMKVPPDRIKDLLGQVGLGQALASAYPHQLSGGQRQRAGIARALALHPRLVVLDEPTASLDVSIQAQIIALLQELRTELGLTYLFISHDLGLVRYFCDRIVVMYLGAIVEDLPSPAARPRHPYTAALMESSLVADPTQRKELTALTGEIPSAFDLPKGCAFAARCTRSKDRCHIENPRLEQGDQPHPVACWNPMPGP
jgi:oligopeptide/dipeptide ABC transporter ATP-binding protein